MQSRASRFWLLFESGPREGERVAIGEGVVLVGRGAASTLVLSHASVSGSHAELRADATRVVLADLGSTNGTRVEGQRVEEHILGHGDRLQFGAVRARFHDAQVAGPPEELHVPGDEAAADRGGLGRVDAGALARSSSRSRLGLLLGVLAVLLLGGVAWWSFGRTTAGEARGAELPAVPGNLWRDASFESADAAEWTSAEGAPRAFALGSAYAERGRRGLGVELAAGEWAYASSPPLALAARRGHVLRAHLALRGPVRGRLGIELTSGREGDPAVRAWTPALEAGESREVVLPFVVPAETARARLLVAGRSTRAADASVANGAEGGAPVVGAVALDDPVLLADEAAVPAPLAYEEYELRVLGEGGTSAILARSGRLLFTAISTAEWRPEGLRGWSGGGWRASATSTGFALELVGAAPPGTRVFFTCYGSRPLGDEGEDTAWIVTLGPGGYQAHATTFERDDASDLLLGRGTNLMRLRRAGERAPAAGPVRAEQRGGDTVLAIDLAGATRVELQLGFDQERVEAETLALRARTATRDGRPGRALAAWNELLDRWAFDADLIDEAEAARAALQSAGHERLEELERALEEAAFFRLEGAYERCRAGARALAAAYAGTSVAEKAAALEARIGEEVALLEADRAGDRGARLRGVLGAVERQGADALAQRVRGALAEVDEGGGRPPR